MAIWTKDNGTHDIVQAAGFDAAAPELRNLSIPATGVVGVPVSFSVAPFDAWPIGPATFAFGDGSEATGNATSHSYGAPGSYPVSVAVTDVAGNVTSQTATIAISPRPGFKIGKLKRNRKKGTGRLPITVEGPGTVVLSGKGVKRSRARAARAGTVQLKVRAVGRKLKKLNRTGKVRLALKITFTPDGGTPKTQRLKAKLVKNPA
jgi:PKD repeat protein